MSIRFTHISWRTSACIGRWGHVLQSAPALSQRWNQSTDPSTSPYPWYSAPQRLPYYYCSGPRRMSSRSCPTWWTLPPACVAGCRRSVLESISISQLQSTTQLSPEVGTLPTSKGLLGISCGVCSSHRICWQEHRRLWLSGRSYRTIVACQYRRRGLRGPSCRVRLRAWWKSWMLAGRLDPWRS